MADYHRPVRLPGGKFDGYHGADDPAETSRISHETAAALLSRVRADPDPAVLARLVSYTDENGIDEIAALWSHAAAHSLPGALWRIYLLRALIRRNPHETSYVFRRGAEVSRTIDPVVAGAAAPMGPTEVIALADQILRGAFEGDFAVALERAAAFCRVSAAGAASVADDLDATEPHRSSELTRRALRFSQLADELAVSARLWREHSLD